MQINQSTPFDDNELFRVRGELASYLGSIEIPTALIEVWRKSNGFYLECVEFYSTTTICERNKLLEVREYCPSYIAIANDSGSRVALLKAEREANAIYLNYSSSMAELEMENIGFSLKQWIEKGCPFELEPQAEISASKLVVIKLDSLPNSGFKGLMEIKKLLGLPISLGELRSIPDVLPYELCTATYIKALRWASKININGKIVSIWSKAPPFIELPQVDPFDK